MDSLTQLSVIQPFWDVNLCENISQFDSAKCIHIFLKCIREKEIQVLRPFYNNSSNVRPFYKFFIKCKSDYLLWNGCSSLYSDMGKEINTILCPVLLFSAIFRPSFTIHLMGCTYTWLWYRPLNHDILHIRTYTRIRAHTQIHLYTHIYTHTHNSRHQLFSVQQYAHLLFELAYFIKP